MTGSKTTNFKLPKLRSRFIKCTLVALYFLAIGIYFYQGFQPYPVDATAPNRLFIPSINLSTPVDDVSKTGQKISVPEVIAGAYSENTNKTLLLGHSSTVFERLGDLKIGDSLVFDDNSYRITKIITVTKAEIDMSDVLAPAEQPTIILMTCTGQHIAGHDYTHRIVITASAI
ncbi:class F sortase [Candidatus Saccharibacteria bacterium]|nr:class F sortase [Candidatus Saccharibacteria bacterium]